MNYFVDVVVVTTNSIIISRNIAIVIVVIKYIPKPDRYSQFSLLCIYVIVYHETETFEFSSFTFS